MTINSGEGGEPILAKEVASMELSVRSKTLTIAFFVVEVQVSYNMILGRDWIHNNRCMPSSLHQFLIQWVDDEVEVVNADAAAYVATVNAPSLRGHDGITCFSGPDLADFEFISINREGFVPIYLKPNDNRFNIIM